MPKRPSKDGGSASPAKGGKRHAHLARIPLAHCESQTKQQLTMLQRNGAMAQGDSEEEGDEGDTGGRAAAAQARSKHTQEKNAVEETERKLKALEAENAVLKTVMHRLFHAHGSYMQSA
jgi:hypothetical protein